MSIPAGPLPVIFEPHLIEKPWGGRRLEGLGKRLPPAAQIGETWEIASVAGVESRVRGGPCAGAAISALLSAWGARLTGNAPLPDGRFPLLVKFLDAREALSVQVHPLPTGDPQRDLRIGVKHEVWYVIDAEPDASVWIGCQHGVTVDQLLSAADSSEIVHLLQQRRVRRGDCFYLPSGTPHALGAGVLVAEVQTPADVTYRLYDWDRRDADGRPRELHIAQACANALLHAPQEMIAQPRAHSASMLTTATRLAACDSFLLDRVRLAAGCVQGLPHQEMVIWIVLSGAATLRTGLNCCDAARGDVVLIPADAPDTVVEVGSALELLEVRIPIRPRAEVFR